MNDPQLVLIVAVLPVLMTGTLIVILARRRGAKLEAAPIRGVLVAVAVVAGGSALLAANGVAILSSAFAVAILVLSIPIAWYAYRSWRQDGWSPRTRRLVFSITAALAFLLFDFVVL